MKLLKWLCVFIFSQQVSCKLSPLMNKLRIKPVGADANDDLDHQEKATENENVLTTESHRRAMPHKEGGMLRALGGRRMNPNDCTATQQPKIVYPGPNVEIVDEFYDDRGPMTVATVVFPTHIDIHHFQVTSPIPYLTVGTIPGLGFHPTTHTPDECEKIYQDFIAAEYSAEKKETSESLEYARIPIHLVPWEFEETSTMSPCVTATES